LSPDQLGVDSLVALDIQSWFRKELNIDYPMLKLLNSPSVNDLISSAVELALPEVSVDAMESSLTKALELANDLRMSQRSMPERSNTVTTTPSPLLTPRTDTHDPSSSEATLEFRIPETNLEGKCQQSGSQPIFERTVPLSFAQTRFWFLASFVEDSSAFNITATVRLEGHIDAGRLSKALAAVGQRHEALRTAFYTDNATKGHMQGILPTMVSCLEHGAIWNDGQVEETVRDFESHVYDLSCGKTLRLKLLSLSEATHWLVLGYHHIALDGIGFQVFFADLEKAYTGSLEEAASDMLQYPDYSVRQRRQYHSGEWSRELQYWREQFVDIPQPLPPLLLSRHQGRPITPSFRTYSVQARLEHSIEMQISDCCRRFQVTPFHFYTTTFAVLLFRYGRNLTENFCIGVADGNRRDADILHSLGLFLNLLPVKFHQHTELSFANALQDARTTIQDAYSHSRVPFDVLLSELSVPRSVTHTPLFQAFVNYRQNIQETTTFCGCAAEGELVSSGRNAYDVSLDIVDSSSGDNLIVLAVNADMYAEEDARVLQRSYIQLLQTFAYNPAARIVWPSLHSHSDADASITLGNGPEKDSEWPATVVDRIDSMIAAYADKPALTDGVEDTLTHRQMAIRMHRIATKLVAHGIHHGSSVGLFQMPGPTWICSLLAVLRIGAACVPLDHNLGTGRLASILKDCRPDVVLVDNDTVAKSSFAQSLGVSVLDSSTFLGRNESSDMAEVQNQSRPEDTAIITYTSGSTGAPKGVILKHLSYRNFFEHTPPRWGIAEGNLTVLQQSAYAFDISILQIFISLCYGGTLVIPDSAKRRDPRALCDMVASQGITLTLATPTEYISWANHGINQLRTSKWKCAMTGGEPLNNAVLQIFRSLDKMDLRLVNCYGPTEATIGCADQVVDYNKDLNDNSEMLVLPNCNVVVVDDNLRPVPAGVPGQILIGGAGIAAGYLNQPELSARAFSADQWPTEYRTAQGWMVMHLSGDRGRLTPDGHLLLHGRIEGSTQIKVRGIRIDLEDIENTIIEATTPHVLHVVVSARKDAVNGVEFLVAFVVFSDANNHPQLDKFLASLPSELPLPQYMRPSVVIAVDQIPKTPSGKVDRAKVDSISLPKPPPIIQDEQSLGLTDGELSLMHLWEEVLPRELTGHGRIEAQSDFFSAGGNSLALVNLQELIKERLHIAVPVYRLFESITLRQMASLLQHGGKDTRVSAPQRVDWGHESEISPAVLELGRGERASTHSTPSGIVAITGATGFLGQELVRQLIDDTEITKVHCLAVRKPLEQLSGLFKDAKIVLHPGNLGSHQFGLNPQAAQEVFTEADVVLHVGADISFLKSYHSLKHINVTPTKELVQLCLPRCIPLHYVSSATVARMSGERSFGPQSARQYPPSERAEGYTASKWVSEVYLENASEIFGLPVYIHRPSSITGIGAPETDLTANLLRYARKTKAIPDLGSGGGGYFDFISVQAAAGTIIEEVKKSMRRPVEKVRYVHESGEVEIATDDVQSLLGIGKSEPFNLLPTHEWIQLAEAEGMDPLLAAYLRRAASGEVLFPRLLREMEGSTE
jgi:hybrid polyketide synthase/nonribosomal peptide synthetase ACE1